MLWSIEWNTLSGGLYIHEQRESQRCTLRAAGGDDEFTSYCIYIIFPARITLHRTRRACLQPSYFGASCRLTNPCPLRLPTHRLRSAVHRFTSCGSLGRYSCSTQPSQLHVMLTITCT